MTVGRIDEGLRPLARAARRSILVIIRHMNGRIDPPSSGPDADAPERLPAKAQAGDRLCALGRRSAGAVASSCGPEDDCLYIGKLAIAPDDQGKGIGRQLSGGCRGDGAERRA